MLVCINGGIHINTSIHINTINTNINTRGILLVVVGTAGAGVFFVP